MKTFIDVINKHYLNHKNKTVIIYINQNNEKRNYI